MTEIKNAMSSRVAEEIKADTGYTPVQASKHDYWYALSKVVMERIADNWQRTNDLYLKSRRQHYFSAEFLVGRALLNNLTNLNMLEEARDAMASFGLDINDILEEETDPALGNGGLGRLAACFMDSCATSNYPVQGYGILYRYGLFYQLIEDGFQTEKPDEWMERDYPFVVSRPAETVLVHFSDFDVKAIPHDMPITGYGTKNVNTLRLWQAKALEEFDFQLFNDQHFTQALNFRNQAQDICRVLYPNDTTRDGKTLRLRQQYFFVSASLQDILHKYIAEHGEDFAAFPKYNCIQLNDTHPVIGILELMRLLIDEYHQTWDDAWAIVTKTFAYTNHTVMQEALEKWDVDLMQGLLPRIYEIVAKLDVQLRQDLAGLAVYSSRIDQMAIVANNQVHMARLACYASFSINGVASMHTEILKRDTLKDWYQIWPERFNNKTNGVTPRRWLRMCNAELSELLTESLGSDAWVTSLDELAKLANLAEDPKILRRFLAIKKTKKQQLANFLHNYEGVDVDTTAIFDVQIKRLHEYKRQLLNGLYILDLYFRVKEDPSALIQPRVFIFGAKAAPGYYRAKSIIKFLNEISRLINNDPDMNGKIKVVFVHNYCVSVAEKLFPAADISEQISTAGLEASGTGNMKFMMNGALTLGTLDGANVEIIQAVGDENGYIFGAKEEELAEIKPKYDPYQLYLTVPGLRRVMDCLTDGTLCDGKTGRFLDLFNGLVKGSGWQAGDVYYVLGDFAAYREARDRAAKDYVDALGWAKKCWINITSSGMFSSDRTINDYAKEIWQLQSLPIE